MFCHKSLGHPKQLLMQLNLKYGIAAYEKTYHANHDILIA